MQKRFPPGVALGLAAAGVAAAYFSMAQDAARTTRDGVYTMQQAERGERVFESICTSCHELSEFTAAGAYLDDMAGRPLWETFEYMAAEMPEDDPGSLAPDEYAAVLAYFFNVLGLPSAAAELPVDAASLEGIAIARPALPGS
jgi:cytochrome c2